LILVEKFDPVKQMRTHPSLINRRSNRLTIEQLKSTKLNFDEQQINVFILINKFINKFFYFRNFKKCERKNI
jgi:hypothetical protein